MILDGIINGIISFILFGLVAGTRRIFHKEGISSFLIHVDKRGRGLFFEGLMLGFLLFAIYPVTIVILGIGSIEITTNNLLHSLLSFLAISFGTLAISVFEESLFRGYIFVKMLSKFSLNTSIIIPSVIFGSFHFFAYSSSAYFWIGLINASIVGVLLCIIVARTNSLMLAIGYHMAWNLLQGILLTDGSLFLTLHMDTGLLTGTSHTPESGFITTGILFIMGIYILLRFRVEKQTEVSNTI